MHENGLLVSNMPYYSTSKKALELRLELVQNLPPNYTRETVLQYLPRLNKVYEDEFINKLHINEKFLFIYLSIITASGRILVPKSTYSEAEISKWINLFSGKRIALNSILSAKSVDKNTYRIKKFTTKIKIKRLSDQEIKLCIEKISLNEYGFFSLIHDFATFVNGNLAHILGIPCLELNNISQSVNSSIPYKDDNKI